MTNETREQFPWDYKTAEDLLENYPGERIDGPEVSDDELFAFCDEREERFMADRLRSAIMNWPFANFAARLVGSLAGDGTSDTQENHWRRDL